MVNDEFHKLFSYTFWLYVPIQPPGHITENANRVAPGAHLRWQLNVPGQTKKRKELIFEEVVYFLLQSHLHG